MSVPVAGKAGYPEYRFCTNTVCTEESRQRLLELAAQTPRSYKQKGCILSETNKKVALDSERTAGLQARVTNSDNQIRTWSDGSQEALFLGKHGVWNGSWDLLQFEKEYCWGTR